MAFTHPTNTRPVRSSTLTLLSSAARTATFTGATVNCSDGSASLLLDVTARSGTTPTLDVTVQTSYDGSTWRTAGTFAQSTAVGSERKSFTGLDRYVRANGVITGTTPSFTCSVTGEAR